MTTRTAVGADDPRRPRLILHRQDISALMRGPDPDEPETEAELQAKILRRCNELGLLHHHCYAPWHASMWGFPDLYILGPRGELLWELKGPDGTLSDTQEPWRRAALAARLRYSVIQPMDWASGEVERRLLAIADEEWDEAA